MNQEELIKELRKNLNDNTAAKEAAHFLSQIELRESLDYLISLLGEKISKEKRIEIIQILGNSKQEKAVEPLKKMLSDENKEIKVSALYSLVKIRNPKVIPILEDAVNIEETKAVALEGLGEMADLIPTERKEEIVDILLNSLNSEEIKPASPAGREEAIVSLGKIKDKRAIPHLIKLFGDSSEEIKKIILKNLGDIRGEEVKEFLSEKLKEEKGIKAEIIVELEKLYFQREDIISSAVMPLNKGLS